MFLIFIQSVHNIKALFGPKNFQGGLICSSMLQNWRDSTVITGGLNLHAFLFISKTTDIRI